MADLTSVIVAQNRSHDNLVGVFERHLREIVLRAQGRVIARLEARLAITDGVIDGTAGNMLLLRNSGKLFMSEMDKAGYQRLVTAFVGEFRQTLPFLQDTLRVLGDQVGQKWGDKLGFTAKDLSLLSGVQANTAAALTGAIEAVAGQAITRGLFGVAGLKFGALVETLTDKLEMSIGKATSVGNTAMSVYFRTASDRAYQIIAKDLPAQVLRFVYQGPDDKLTRDYCEKMLARTKKTPLTREEIGKFPNGQLPNPFITGGGYGCRHGFYLSTRDLELEEAA